MTKQESVYVDSLRAGGMMPAKIAAKLGLSPNTVYSYLRRHSTPPDAKRCPVCGKAVLSLPSRKPKTYCSDACRMAWWRAHSDIIHRRAYYPKVCAFCGKEFQAYGNRNRTYCCRDCYRRACRSVQPGESAAVPHVNGAG